MAEDLKDKILETASALFDGRGVRDVTIEDVCRTLSISKKTFYQYYSQKEDLVFDVIQSRFETRKQFLSSLCHGKNAIEILGVASTLMAQKHWIDKESRMASDVMKYYPETFRKSTVLRESDIRKTFVSYVLQGQEEGFFQKDIDVEAQALVFGFIHKGIAKYGSGNDSIPGKKISHKRLCSAFAKTVGLTLFTEEGWEAYHELFKDQLYEKNE